jgi:hypothetical protein
MKKKVWRSEREGALKVRKVERGRTQKNIPSSIVKLRWSPTFSGRRLSRLMRKKGV